VEQKKEVETEERQEYDVFQVNFKLKTHKTYFINLEDLAEFVKYRLEPMGKFPKHCTLIIGEMHIKKQE